VRRLATLVFLGLVPVLAVGHLAFFVASGEAELVDFRVFYGAGKTIVAGESPYPDFVYPPPVALLVAPLALLSQETAELVVLALLGVTASATLAIAGVRDWRVYGIAFLWPSTLSALQTGNVTLLLALAAAVAWRFRDRRWVSGASIGLALALKFILWPLLVWLVVTRRYGGAAVSLATGVLVLLGTWAALGFSGLGDYVDIARGVQDIVEGDAYTIYVVAMDAGAPSPLARALWLAVGIALLAGVVALARRGDESGAFALAIAATLALSPIVWLHYFALVLVALAVVQPRLGPPWFVPLAMWITPGSGNPTPLETAVTLGAAALAVSMALVWRREPAQEAAARPMATRVSSL
jgi:hypothetical protein